MLPGLLRLRHILSLLLLVTAPAKASLELKPLNRQDSRWQGGAYPDTTFEGMSYVSTLFLESLFAREGSWIPDRQKYVISDSAGRRWTFTLDNPYMNIGDEVFNLGFPARRGPDLLYLPVPSLLRILNGRMNLGITAPADRVATSAEKAAGSGSDVSAPARRPGTRPSPDGFNILAVETEVRDNGTLVSLRTSGPLELETFWVAPHFILKFAKGLLSPRFPTRAPGQGLVKQILAVQEKDLAQVTLNIPRAIDTVEVTYSDTEEGPNYLITVRKKSSRKEAAKGDLFTGGKGTIILDPGHGGRDQGAMIAGINEAQVTLAVAKELKSSLTRMGYKAILTRETDEFVSLDARPKFASS
ncbi:MAG TPA: N-acetylmuramoyl-L-alanine amidase, partial [Fibrobacteria bacterium]|nr:N-acetylmuramoyl-L-alanine amidase [Fibrobacteria bacterium]